MDPSWDDLDVFWRHVGRQVGPKLAPKSEQKGVPRRCQKMTQTCSTKGMQESLPNSGNPKSGPLTVFKTRQLSSVHRPPKIIAPHRALKAWWWIYLVRKRKQASMRLAPWTPWLIKLDTRHLVYKCQCPMLSLMNFCHSTCPKSWTS